VLGPVATNAQVLFSGSISNFNNVNLGTVLRWIDGNNWYKSYIDGSNLVIQKKINGSATVLGQVSLRDDSHFHYIKLKGNMGFSLKVAHQSLLFFRV